MLPKRRQRHARFERRELGRFVRAVFCCAFVEETAAAQPATPALLDTRGDVRDVRARVGAGLSRNAGGTGGVRAEEPIGAPRPRATPLSLSVVVRRPYTVASDTSRAEAASPAQLISSSYTSPPAIPSARRLPALPAAPCRARRGSPGARDRTALENPPGGRRGRFRRRGAHAGGRRSP